MTVAIEMIKDGIRLRKCYKCKEFIPLSKFYFWKKVQRYIPPCKKCKLEMDTIRRHKYPEKYYTLQRNLNRRAWRHTPFGMYSTYQSNAKKTNIPFKLGPAYFKRAITAKCYYCGRQYPEVTMGLDRKNSKKGYIIGNIIPCCWDCNRSKTDWSPEKYINHCKRIIDYQLEKERRKV